MSRGVVSLAAALLLAGCGPIRTPGTENKAESELTLLQVPAHHPNLGTFLGAAHLNGIDIDQVAYELDGYGTSQSR